MCERVHVYLCVCLKEHLFREFPECNEVEGPGLAHLMHALDWDTTLCLFRNCKGGFNQCITVIFCLKVKWVHEELYKEVIKGSQIKRDQIQD